ncbi:response regulator [Sandaracinobacteroides sp. A072]|uniref:response regulator n=1 Tax=Sandaracinobacteroides sp. A072 TaxID=3461146 RepID=UPI004042BBE3
MRSVTADDPSSAGAGAEAGAGAASAARRTADVRTGAVGLFAAALAHDLNNMLAGILAIAELLEARADPGSADARDLAAIIDQAGRAGRLLGQVLAFARQDVLRPVSADLAAMVQALLPMLRALAGPGLKLAMSGRGPLPVRLDPAALERVLTNLVLNAREAMQGNGGTISIDLFRIDPGSIPPAGRAFMPAARYAALSVTDEGPGIAPDIAHRIFDPYFTTRADGQGLGLATSFGLVKQSGGFLLQDAGPRGGARFTLFLPLAAGSGESAGLAGSAPGPAAGVVRAAGQVILLCEDDLLLRLSVSRALERRGYRVRQSADAQSALARLAQERPDLLLSDIRLTGMDGVALAMRARSMHPGLPVLLTSGHAGQAPLAAMPGLDVAFLPKPFSLHALGRCIEKLLCNPPAAS